MNRRLLRLTAGSLGIAAIALACWIIAGLVADRFAQQELHEALRTQREITRSIVDTMAEVIASDLSLSRAIPATLAETGIVQRALTQAAHYAANLPSTEPARRAALLKVSQLASVNDFLHNAQGFSGLDTIWLVDADGICVASSNAGGKTPYVGVDMRAHAYLTDALLGAFAETYGVGDENSEPGIFIAAPVYDQGLLVGAVVAKVGISRLRHWVTHPGTFVSDGNGVIVMAHNSALEGLTVPGSRIEGMSTEERMSTYMREHFGEISLRPAAQAVRERAPWVPGKDAGQMVELPGTLTPALYEFRGGLNSGLSAHLVDPLNAWPELLASHRRNRQLVLITLIGIVALAAVISVSWVRERRLHRATRELADQLKAANALLAAEARDDVLTGALSRRYFLDLLRHEIDESRVSGVPMCMAIADLDHFKQINDGFGHAAGDRALQHFVETCRAELRPDDAVGRLGGEEFGILLPATDLTAGLQVIDRLRQRVKVRACHDLPAAINLSVSIGITELAANQEPPERMMRRADRALYVAKARGRDRCEAMPPDDTVPPRTAATTW